MSKVSLSGLNKGNHCGYCNKNGSSSYGLNCKLMRASDYEYMMLKGWRRCGSYYYKPNLPESCCKLNTIRCDAVNFTPNRSQKKVANKFTKFLNGVRTESDIKKSKKAENKSQVPSQLEEILSNSLAQSLSGLCEFQKDFVKITKNLPNRVKQFGHYSISSILVVCGRHKSIAKADLLQVLTETLSKNLQNTQFSILNTMNFHINLIDNSSTNDTQMSSEAGGSSKPEPLTKSSQMEVESSKHTYTTELVPADFTEESFDLYKEYQIAVHKDSPESVGRHGYSNFLCGKNLINEKPSELYPLGLGNFHQLHRIDGKLIAVGVIDLLPTGVSSVYFFYSPQYQHLSLGVWGALKEIELIEKNKTESFRYYYMGFYIDTCVKMRYKGDYLPSQLLCPVKYVWVDIGKCLENKDVHKFLSLRQCDEETKNQADEDMNWTGVDYLGFLKEFMKIEYNGSVIKFENFNQNGQNFIVRLMCEAQPYLSKWMIKRLVFKLG